MSLSFLVSPETIEQQKLVASQVQNAYDTRVKEDMATQRTQMMEDVADKRQQAMEDRAFLRDKTMREIEASKENARADYQRNAQREDAAKAVVNDTYKDLYRSVAPIDQLAKTYANFPDSPEKQAFLGQITANRADLFSKFSQWQQAYLDPNKANNTITPPFDYANHPLFTLPQSPDNPILQKKMDLIDSETKQHLAEVGKIGRDAGKVNPAAIKAVGDYVASTSALQSLYKKREQLQGGTGQYLNPNDPSVAPLEQQIQMLEIGGAAAHAKVQQFKKMGLFNGASSGDDTQDDSQTQDAQPAQPDPFLQAPQTQQTQTGLNTFKF